MDYWAKPALDRHQVVLFSPTLDDSVGNDYPVRLLDEMLKGLDWTAWTAEYDGQKGHRLGDHLSHFFFRESSRHATFITNMTPWRNTNFRQKL